METQEWIACSIELPPNGQRVETKIDDAHGCRNVQTLKRSGNLWFLVDGSMYVYYTPTHWRPIAETPLEREMREVDEAFAAFRRSYIDARTDGATREEVCRYAIALETLIHELRDVRPYSENA